MPKAEGGHWASCLWEISFLGEVPIADAVAAVQCTVLLSHAREHSVNPLRILERGGSYSIYEDMFLGTLHYVFFLC